MKSLKRWDSGSAIDLGFRRKTPYVLVGRIRRFVRGGGAC